MPRQTEGVSSMGWLSNLWAHFRAPFTVDDILNAESEDALRDVHKGEAAVIDARAKAVTSDDKLRKTLRAARERTRTFEQFEERIRQRTRDVH